jgi:hypothetical protein
MDVGGTWWGQNRWNEGPVVETEANVSGGVSLSKLWPGRGAVVEIVDNASGETGAVVEVVAKGVVVEIVANASARG